ncbi:MAG: NYN domain-containing protein [Candidatus Thorarchaeota archaeon]|nr:MAG: hypothetical protein DRP09_05905 [Candidatus Thorarchaeota archaeon]RLI58668.1 MAG: hypothetical protein DRO87_05120 [Candidatus Thorarchaeota archaeon]
MPKRARCPYCDRLFSRDVLDDHIRRCRTRRRPAQRTTPRRRLLVVDGNNVAFFLSPNGRPRVSNLVLAHQSLASAGFQLIFVVSSALVHKVGNPIALREFTASVRTITAPRGTDDDLKIIRTAQEMNADIVSNDRFLNWIDRFTWLPDRIRKYRMTPAGLILL